VDIAQNDGRAVTWALRRHALLLVGIVITSVALALLLAERQRRSPSYTATALVIATDLQVRQEQLPRFGEAVFDAGSVARAVADTLPTADYRTLVPERISLDPVMETIAFRVHGHSSDAAEAARLANAAAAAFVDNLNKAGQGVGAFTLQDPAFVPREPEGVLSLSVAGVIGLAGGAILAVGVLSLLVAVRRPVLSAAAAASAAEAPLVAVVPLQKESFIARRIGVQRLLEALPHLSSSAVELVGPRGSARQRRELLALLEEQVGELPGSDVRNWQIVVTDPEDDSSPAVRMMAPAGPAPEDELLAAVLVVVPEGAPARTVRDVVLDFPPEEICGTVFVRERARRFRRRTRRKPSHPAMTPKGSGTSAASAVGVPEPSAVAGPPSGTGT
jgi:hypothetical protein